MLNARIAGSGPAALLIHGFPLDHRMWSGQFELASDNRRIVAVDLRGHGQSPFTDAPHTMDLLADDLAEFAGAEVFDVVGLSMGGYVALALWERHPHVFRSLALVDTKAGADSEEGKAGRNATADAVVENGRGWLSGVLMPKLVADDAPASVRAKVRTMIEGQTFESIVADLYGMRDRPDRSGVLSSISVPTAVIVGEHDVLTPPSEAEAMAAAIPGAKLAKIPGAAHMAPLEVPEAVNQALADLWG